MYRIQFLMREGIPIGRLQLSAQVGIASRGGRCNRSAGEYAVGGGVDASGSSAGPDVEGTGDLGVEGEVDIDGEIEQDEDVKGLAVELRNPLRFAEEPKAQQRGADGDDGRDGEIAAGSFAHAHQAEADVDEVTAKDRDEESGEIFAVGGDEQEV